MYTTYMPITSTNSFTLATIQRLTIDCSALQTPTADQEIEALLEWAQTVRMRSSIHVTLRFSTNNPLGRKVRSRFQSLGCTVRMQTQFSL